MFSLEWLEDVANGAVSGLMGLNTRVLEALGRSIAKAREGSEFDRISSLSRAEQEADELYQHILTELGKSTISAEEIYTKAAQLAYQNANVFYAARGLKQLPLEFQTALVNFVNATAKTTRGTFTNLSNTTAIGYRVMGLDGEVVYKGFKEHYHDLVDQAISEVASGQRSYSSAFRNALKQTADSGIRVLDYESGYSRRLDSAVRQNVIDGVKNIAQEVARHTGEEFGADGVEVDAHNYCAPDHLPYQGRQFSKAEFDEIQNSLPRQFGQWNCRHTYYPILLGLSEPLYTEDERQQMIAQSTEKIEFEGKEYTRYEATQLQRRIETAVRHSKDRAIIARASGDDLTRRIEQLRINQLKQKYGEITNTFKTPPALDRMSVSGFRPVKIKDFVYEKWENPKYRVSLSESFELNQTPKYAFVKSPQNVVDKIAQTHPTDFDAMKSLELVLNDWSYKGISPKNPLKLELYRKIDDIWYTAVIKDDEGLNSYILTTFHRILERKLLGRIKRDYLKKR